jgi:aminoglycoside 6-adenylyltransferase
MFKVIIRPCLQDLLSWYAAWKHCWQVDTGLFGKWLKRFLPAEIWEAYSILPDPRDFVQNRSTGS